MFSADASKHWRHPKPETIIYEVYMGNYVKLQYMLFNDAISNTWYAVVCQHLSSMQCIVPGEEYVCGVGVSPTDQDEDSDLGLLCLSHGFAPSHHPFWVGIFH